MRNVFEIPEAIPPRDGATMPRAERAMAGFEMATPTPVSTMPGMSTNQVEVAPIANISPRPMAVTASPKPSATPGASRSMARRPAIGTMKQRTVEGSSRSPPWSGE